MGRIKTKLIKRVTNDLVEEYSTDLRNNFTENKKFVEQFTTGTTKKIRNVIAGYATRQARFRENQ